MRNLSNYFQNRTIQWQKLLESGFIQKEDSYYLERPIVDGLFQIVMKISLETQTSKVIDLSTEEDYALVDVPSSSGNFVGRVKEEYEKVIQSVIQNCTTPNVFQEVQSQRIISYIQEKYGDTLEFLWENSNSAIWRNQLTQKWYGVLMTIPESRLKIQSDRIVEVIDLRYEKEHIDEIVDNEKVFPGYHMNKRSWITLKLDGSIEEDVIHHFIDNSYLLSKKNNRKKESR